MLQVPAERAANDDDEEEEEVPEPAMASSKATTSSEQQVDEMRTQLYKPEMTQQQGLAAGAGPAASNQLARTPPASLQATAAQMAAATPIPAAATRPAGSTAAAAATKPAASTPGPSSLLPKAPAAGGLGLAAMLQRSFAQKVSLRQLSSQPAGRNVVS
jgi:hypothetical protein